MAGTQMRMGKSRPGMKGFLMASTLKDVDQLSAKGSGGEQMGTLIL